MGTERRRSLWVRRDTLPACRLPTEHTIYSRAHLNTCANETKSVAIWTKISMVAMMFVRYQIWTRNLILFAKLQFQCKLIDIVIKFHSMDGLSRYRFRRHQSTPSSPPSSSRIDKPRKLKECKIIYDWPCYLLLFINVGYTYINMRTAIPIHFPIERQGIIGLRCDW